ncbi:MAG: DUF2339 domain-containing protein [Bacteroidales bacterium]|nr:DUF2339 domain-containing protein [Bacteroidales bacterium]MCF8405327.1 DUF2339 domain-containing protein [Bacteroidales bacterium]
MTSKSDHLDNSAISQLIKKIDALEKRIVKLERQKQMSHTDSTEEEDDFEPQLFKFSSSEEDHLESRFGEYGLAWLGNIVLFFGITYFVQYLQVNEFKFISPLFGFISVAGIFALAYFTRKNNPYISKIFWLNAYLLLFYVFLKLHFFTPDPVILNKGFALSLLFLVSIIWMVLAIRKAYSLLSVIAVIMFAVTAIFSDTRLIIFLSAIALSLTGTYLFYYKGWVRTLVFSILLSYSIILLWTLNNPVVGNPLHAIPDHSFGHIIVLIIAAIYSLVAIVPVKEGLFTKSNIISLVLLNGFGFVFVITHIVVTFIPENYFLLTGFIALYCILYSVLLQLRSELKINAALYALFGFVILSVTSVGIYDFPNAYFLLSIQSLLVVSIAIWFRSKFIVIMNTALFLTLLLVYLSKSVLSDEVNISFTLVALATARIINWKKERLTIRTEMIRNFYLIVAFFMVLFTLYHAVPDQYITFSWTLAAALFFVLSLVLKNVKYRYLALGTMVAAALYLFIVDLARIDLVYRVIALLFLSAISFGLSFYYAKKLRKKTSE